ncbi:hypothetical protein JTB14_005895 [Gonioctena quinquepunctata]|nr:hypothetical protein JTB14_005895 [Gonioctena quinquepunctata]
MDESQDRIFNNDPIFMKSLVGKKVEIRTVDNKTHIGIVYVIDPIFKTIVLHANLRNENDFETIFILHHAIESLKVLSDEVQVSYILEETKKDGPEHLARRMIVKKWLEHMFINVNESGDYLKIDDHLVIVPPYGPENCICNNTIILDRIQKILELMPQEFF